MSDFLSRLLQAAQRDKNLSKKLREIADIESKIMAPRLLAVEGPEFRKFEQMYQKAIGLCYEVARAIATPNEDIDEIARWISNNHEQVTLRLDSARR